MIIGFGLNIRIKSNKFIWFEYLNGWIGKWDNQTMDQ